MNSFRFIERGIRAEIARQERLLARRGSRSSRRRCTSIRAPRRSRRCAPRRRRTTTATSPSPTSPPVADHRGDARARPRRDARAAGGARRALRRELGLSAESARLLAFRAELGDYFEAALAAGDGARAAAALANWVAASSRRAIEVEDPARRRSSPRRSPSSSRWSPTRRSPQGGAKQVLEHARRRRRRPRARSSRPRASARSAAATSSRRSCARRSRRTPTSAEKLRGGDMKPIGVIVGHVMRETRGPRRRQGGHGIVRAQLGL